MTTSLLLIDVQNDYFPGGKMELEGSLEAAQQARRLLDCFRQRHLPLVHIQHLAVRPGATFFLPGTKGAQIHPLVAPLEGETLFQKNYPNSFRQTSLLEHLHSLSVDRLVIAGSMTHMCIDATTRAAYDHGFQCLVAHDACATRALNFGERTVPAADVHAAFLAALKSTFATVLSVEEILKESEMQ
ncbi:MAG TPA: cysteine hydrolase family protein [Anaerolineaceae bacterium]|nr:cysteine hydrolase family protein [Anaerolineaceae bacterium]